MHYLERGLAARNWPKVGRALGLFYAAAMVIGCLGIGNMFQSNQATAILIDVTGGANSVFADRAWLVGLLLAASVGLVIIGGIRSIANTTSKLVPAMAILYVLSALTIIALNAEALPGAIAAIWNGAFSPPRRRRRRLGGVMILGFRRAVFSNEAGLGSGGHRPRRGAHRRAGERGIRRLAGTLHRHGGDLHPDGAGDHHHRVRSGAGRQRRQRHRAHHPGLREPPCPGRRFRCPSPPSCLPTPPCWPGPTMA